ncbi:MAG: peroxiredoxin family protein [Bacteroidales bacterium]
MKAKNNKYCILRILLLFMLPLFSSAQHGDVIIYGEAPEYKNEELTFYTYSDIITRQDKPLATTKVDEDGNFRCSIPIKDTMEIFMHLGVYRAFLFAEPGNEYKIKLPKRKDKSKEQKLNPYFRGKSYHVEIEDGKEQLNFKIYEFLRTYNRIVNQNIKKIYNSPQILDSLYNVIDTAHSSENLFFQHYKDYKLGELKLISANQKSSQVVEELFKKEKIHYHNPAYMDLFNQTFENYFEEFYSEYDRNIDKLINQAAELTQVDSILGKAELLSGNKKLRELVMLKGMHDAYYSNNYKKSSIIKLLEKFQEYSNEEYHQEIAKNIHDKITRIRTGFEPPEFCLYDLDSNLVCLDSLKGNYIYLGFCNTENYSCLRQFKALNNLYEKHKNHFKIIVISTDESFEQLKRHAERNQYPWKILHYGNDKEILKKYNVKSQPLYFFIVPDGTLSLSPAPSPAEKVEQKIFIEMRKRGDI